MRVSAAQFFAMQASDRAKVTHIDMDLDREAERRLYAGAVTGRFQSRHIEVIEPIAEPGSDWTGKDSDQ